MRLPAPLSPWLEALLRCCKLRVHQRPRPLVASPDDLLSGGAGKPYSTGELDRIIADIFSLDKGGSASKSILPEGDVCRLCDMAKEILQVGCWICPSALFSARRGVRPCALTAGLLCCGGSCMLTVLPFFGPQREDNVKAVSTPVMVVGDGA